MSDRRSLFATPRVAHVSLQGQHAAPRYAEGKSARIGSPVASLHPDPESPKVDRQLLHGASVAVLEEHGSRAFVRDEDMRYVGWVARAALAAPSAPTHWVSVRSSFCFDNPDFKSPGPIALPFGARVTVAEVTARYAALAAGGFMILDHLTPMTAPAPDPVSCAEAHLGTPYLWGGNSSFGIDCSGLVQVSLSASGIPCPGDSDQQEATLGQTLPPGSIPQRGDLFFWKGHVAWVSGAEHLIHANAHHMAVAYEPIFEACARIAAQGGGPVTRHARLA